MIYEKVLASVSVGSVSVGQLHSEITANVTITKTCVGVTHHEPDQLIIEFASALSTAEETELDGVVLPGHTPA